MRDLDTWGSVGVKRMWGRAAPRVCRRAPLSPGGRTAEGRLLCNAPVAHALPPRTSPSRTPTPTSTEQDKHQRLVGHPDPVRQAAQAGGQGAESAGRARAAACLHQAAGRARGESAGREGWGVGRVCMVAQCGPGPSTRACRRRRRGVRSVRAQSQRPGWTRGLGLPPVCWAALTPLHTPAPPPPKKKKT